MQHTHECDVCGSMFYTYCFGSDGSGGLVYEPPLLPEVGKIFTKDDSIEDMKAYEKVRMSHMFKSKLIPLCASHLGEYNAKL